MDRSISCRNGIFDAHQFFTDISLQPSYASARCNVFFLFYGMHTEPEFDYRIELYHIAKFIMYATTVMNIIGITCLMFGFKFEWYWIKFTVYENRFIRLLCQPESPRLHSCGVDFLLPYTFKRAFYAQNCRKHS